MKTLNERYWELFWKWIQGASCYKLGLIEGIDKSNVRDICERRLTKAFKGEMMKKNKYRQGRKFIRTIFPTLKDYQIFYERNKKNGKL